MVQQRVVRSPGRSDPGGSVPPTSLAAAAREGVTTAPAGSRVLVLHDRTDLQRLGDELTVAHTLTTALRAQTHEHAIQLHTALALVESGRLEAARAVLSRRAADEEASDDVLAALLTALGNLVLLCGHHHRTIHTTPWRVRLNPDDGRPEFLPPAKPGRHHPAPEWIRQPPRPE